MKTQYGLVVVFFAGSFLLAQNAPSTAPDSAAHSPATSSAPANASANKGKTPDRAAAYYHFALAHMYEEQVATYGRSELTSKAIEEYRAAIDADPTSAYLTSGLAELYAKTGRIRDAVVEAQDIIKRDPNNLEARRLLGRIYLRSLGDMQAGNGSDSVLKLAIEQYEQIVRLQPASMDDHLLLGRLYRLNSDLRKAETEFKTAVKLQPDSEEAVTTLAYLYNELGDTGRAAEVLSSVPGKDRSAKLYSALGYTYEQQKQYKSAVDAYRHAIELDRDNLDAIRGLAENLQNDGQADAALEQYKIIADANPDGQTYLRIAEIYRKQGKYDLALESLKKAESMLQDSVEVPYNIASIYQAQGRFDEAVPILRDLLKKTEKADGSYSGPAKSNRAVFLERLGTIYREQGNNQAAIETFRQVIALGGDENIERGYQQIIDTWREAKEWQKATDVAKEAVQKVPKSRDLKMVLAAQQADMGEADKALKDVRAMLKGDADDRQIYITLSQMNTRLRRFSDAEQALDKAEQLSTKDDDKEYVWFLRGSTFEREKRYADAEEQFKKVLASDPQHASALNYLGYMLADQNMKLEEALGYIKRAVELDPSNGAYLDSIGWAYFRLGKFDLAEENLTKASQKINTDPTVHDHLGDLYQKTGRLKLAASNWERALTEWGRTISAEVDPADVARVQKKLDSAKVKLAREDAGKQ
jgi:tetratricopeptide (TPR) repeat protein